MFLGMGVPSPVGRAQPSPGRLELVPGHEEGLLVRLLRTPGAEGAAVHLTASDPERFLARLRELDEEAVLETHRLVVEAEMRLRDGDRMAALDLFRQAAQAYRERMATDGMAAYPVLPESDPPLPVPDELLLQLPFQRPRFTLTVFDGRTYRALLPFDHGCGSQEDNGLIRRFIALEAWADVDEEFARMAEIHRLRTEPHVQRGAVTVTRGNRTYVRPIWLRAQPSGLDRVGLGFALDHAYFLRARGRLDKALTTIADAMAGIDLDRDPNRPRGVPVTVRGEPLTPNDTSVRVRSPASSCFRTPWITRLEFIQQGLQFHRQAGREARLERRLREAAAQGHPAALRTLARIRVLQSRPLEATALELEYLEQGRLTETTRRVRRGMVLQDAGRHREAITVLEEALAGRTGALMLPDPTEEEIHRRFERAPPPHGVPITVPRATWERDLLTRLRTLYESVGDRDRMLATTLRRLDHDGDRVRPEALAEARTLFRTQGRREEFDTWLESWTGDDPSPARRASALWATEAYAEAAEVIGRAELPERELQTWRRRLHGQGPEVVRRFQIAWTEARPEDAMARLRLLLDLGREDDAEVEDLLEGLLGRADSPLAAWSTRHGPARPSRSVYDAAYHLIRRYERDGRSDRIADLVLRVAEGHPPFTWRAHRLRPNEPWLLRPDDDVQIGLLIALHTIYAGLPHLQRPEDRTRIQAAAESVPCVPLRAQVARLIHGPEAPVEDPLTATLHPVPAVRVRTPGLPEGVRILTSRDDVRCISPDGAWTGTSWGLVRYRRRDGLLDIVQIPLGDPVDAIAASPRGLFAVSPKGLFWIEDPDADVPIWVRTPVEWPSRDRYRSSRWLPPDMFWHEDAVWVRLGQRAISYRPDSGDIRTFEPLDGPVMFAAHGRVWGGQGVYAADRGTFEGIGDGELGGWFIGATSDAVWATVESAPGRPHQIARVDPASLRADRIPSGPMPSEGRAPFSLLGEVNGWAFFHTGGGLLVAVDSQAAFPRAEWLANPQSWEAKRLPPGEPSFWDRRGIRRWHATGRQDSFFPSAYRDQRPEVVTSIPAGTARLVGAVRNPVGPDQKGGLFRARLDDLAWERLGHPADALADMHVTCLTVDAEAGQIYVGTEGGLTILSLPDATVARTVTVTDGLPSNRIEAAVRIGRKLYLACAIGERTTDLAELDLDTGLIQVRGEADGLRRSRIHSLRADGDHLVITYAWIKRGLLSEREISEMRPGGLGQSVFPGTVFDTATKVFREGATLPPPPFLGNDSPLPVLGGPRHVDAWHGGVRYLGGPRGLVLLEEPARR